MDCQFLPGTNNRPYIAKINPQPSPPPPFILNKPLNEAGCTAAGGLWGHHEHWKTFLSMTGGTILYCLSALSIVYGMWRLIGPVMAQSSVFSQVLPCILAVNLYELALLGVLVGLVLWRHVTDDAISLLILIAIFMIVSGLTLTTATPGGPQSCLWIGLVCAALGVGKLIILRKWISIQIGIISLTGLSIILAWNFIIPSLLSTPFVTGDWPEELRRQQWVLSWLVLLGGALFVLVEAIGSDNCRTEPSETAAFVSTHAMMRIFSLILISAAFFHQHAIRFMFLVDGAAGDYLPALSVLVLLSLELMRSFPKRWARLEMGIAWIPLAAVLYAIQSKAVFASFADASQWLFYPPVLLALIGMAVLWMAAVQRRQGFGYVALGYAFGVLLTVGFSPARPYALNWRLCGGVLVAVLLMGGILKRNPGLCFAAVILLAAGLGGQDRFGELADGFGLTVGGAVAAVAGLGTMLICLAFGNRTPKPIAVFGAMFLALSICDAIPPKSSLGELDLTVVAGVLALCAGLWLRMRDAITIGILCLPLLPRLMIMAKSLSSWGFVVLSFVLLFLGAAVSFFSKQASSNQDIEAIEFKG